MASINSRESGRKANSSAARLQSKLTYHRPKPVIQPLSEIEPDGFPLVGGKAVGLSRLIRAGLPVPEGFVLDARAYTQHMCRLSKLVNPLLSELPNASAKKRQATLETLRQVIVEEPLPQNICSQIERHYRLLQCRLVAVRSSATAEDMLDFSFAGQHGTYFVSGLKECLQAVKHCWASLWTERAFEYRESNRFPLPSTPETKEIDAKDTEMAVVIQKMVPADVSGVLFTADPVNGQADRLVIEACFGLGETLVSGKVTPDRFVLAKEDLTVVEQEIAHKTVAVKAAHWYEEADLPDDELAEDKADECVERHNDVAELISGVYEQVVSGSVGALPCLDQSMAAELGWLALRAEKELGIPQDIEWAIKDGKIFFLQARPITTLGRLHVQKPAEQQAQTETGPDEPSYVWSNVNTGEILPDVVTPMTWSVIEQLTKPIFDSVFKSIGLNIGDSPVAGLIAGRAYFNLTTLAGAFQKLPGFKKMDMTAMLGGGQGKLIEQAEIPLKKEDLPDFGFNPLKMAIGIHGLAFWYLRHRPQAGEAFITKTRKEVDRLKRVNLATFSNQELLKHLDGLVSTLNFMARSVAFSCMAMFLFTTLDTICRRWLEDTDGALANRLVAGVGGMVSAEAGLALWQLALLAHEEPSIEQVILSGKDGESALCTISELEWADEFVAQFEAFNRQFGHHTRGELELANPRWSEQPGYVLDVVKGYLQSIDKIDPLLVWEKSANESEWLARQCHDGLRSFAKRKVFKFVLEQARHGSVIRENAKSLAVEVMVIIRMALLEMAERLTGRGALEKKDDIFFLKMEEIEPLVNGPNSEAVAFMIEERKREHQRNGELCPPQVVVGSYDSNKRFSDNEQEDVEILSGTAVSPGVVTGRARVILKSDGNETLKAGEILVAPFTDPGWTPYFIPAAAIVMDMGGLLSHGSIIAREYGIPAVVNVGPATKRIETGQLIQVDGTLGLVRILGDADYVKRTLGDSAKKSARKKPKELTFRQPRGVFAQDVEEFTTQA